MSEITKHLVCKKVTYYAPKDEDAFFWWLRQIECITIFQGVGDELYLELTDGPIQDTDLDDLIGFFYRYNIDMKQLAQFLTPANKEWFHDNTIAFWHERVFGTLKKQISEQGND